MLELLRILWRAEDGQDLVEYTLLICFVAIIAAGICGFGGSSIKGIVNTSNSQLAVASQTAGS